MFITAHVAKRAKVMFLQVFVILSPTGGEVLHQTRSQHIPPRTRSEHLPPTHLGLGHSTPPPPPPHLGLGHSTPSPYLRLGHSIPPPPSRDQFRTSTPPGTQSLHPAPPPTWDLVTPPPPPYLRLGHSTPPPPKLHLGGRYASYWNASLLNCAKTNFTCCGKNLIHQQ